jgi:hypothetical protein
MAGAGRFAFASGAVYEGGFAAGRYEGAGSYTWPDGRRYEVRACRAVLQGRRAGGGWNARPRPALREGMSQPAAAASRPPRAAGPAAHPRPAPPHTPPQGAWVGGVMHGEGAFTDAAGRRWAGHFFGGSGPGLTFQL